MEHPGILNFLFTIIFDQFLTSNLQKLNISITPSFINTNYFRIFNFIFHLNLFSFAFHFTLTNFIGRQYKESNKGGYGPIDIPSSPINPHTNNTIKIGTHNIRGINTAHEQMIFSHYLETHNFDIIGISETKFKESATNFAFKEQSTYKCFWSSNDLEPRGTGVGLLIKKDIAKHIQKVFRLDGRLLSVTLLLKGKRRILIIQVYLPSDKKSSRIY